MRLVIVLSLAAAVTVMIGAILVAVSVVMRMVTKHQPAHMTRLGLDVVAAGIAFGLIVLVVFAIGRIGGAGRSRPRQGRADHRRGAPAPSPRRPPEGMADHRDTAKTGAGRGSQRSGVPPEATPGARAERVPGGRPRSSHERVLTWRPHRHARGWPTRPDGQDIPEILRTAGAAPVPGRPGARGGPGSVGRSQELEWVGPEAPLTRPAALGPGRTSAAVAWLPAGHQPGRSRPPRRTPREASRGAPCRHAIHGAPRGAAPRLPDAGPAIPARRAVTAGRPATGGRRAEPRPPETARGRTAGSSCPAACPRRSALPTPGHSATRAPATAWDRADRSGPASGPPALSPYPLPGAQGRRDTAPARHAGRSRERPLDTSPRAARLARAPGHAGAPVPWACVGDAPSTPDTQRSSARRIIPSPRPHWPAAGLRPSC